MKKILWLLILLVLCSSVQAMTVNYTRSNNWNALDTHNAPVVAGDDVIFGWDGTTVLSVPSGNQGQISNAFFYGPYATLFGMNLHIHNLTIYGPGTYTVYDGCPAGYPGCGTGNPITFTVDVNEIGGHFLFNLYTNQGYGYTDIDVVNVWMSYSIFGPSVMAAGTCYSDNFWWVWDWMSKDWQGNGINGFLLMEGPLAGSIYLNFNMMGLP